MTKNPTAWQADTKHDPNPALSESIETDIAVIGGGITGITTAYLLAKAGKSVVVLEKGTLGQWATGRTTAIITKSIDMHTRGLISTMGKERAQKVLESHQVAIDTIARIVADERMDCEFVRGENFMFANTAKDLDAVREEFDALTELGVDTTYQEARLPGFTNAGTLSLAHQAKFHPLKYLFALAEVAQRNGAQIYEGTEVTEVSGKGPFVLTTPNGTVTAQKVVAATYGPFKQPAELFFLKARYQTYMMEVELPAGLIAEGSYEDTDNPYHYFRIDAGTDKDRMLIGGEDHRSDIKVNPDKSFAALEDYLAALIPRVEYLITRKWAGTIIEPVDGLAYVGALHPDFYFATSYSGTGMTYGTLAGMLITDSIAGIKNEYADLYQISRGLSLPRTAVKVVDYVEELFGGAVANTFKYNSDEVEGKANDVSAG